MRFTPKVDRITGVVVPLGALRTEESVGVGEFLDLIELGDFCARTGLSIIQLLPVNDSGFQSSPYSALTAFALHPLYLRIGALEEAKAFKKKIAALRTRFEGAARFPYGEILAAKLDLLREIYAAAADGVEAAAREGGELDRWIIMNPWVREYAVYRNLKDANGGKHWKEWREYAAPSAADIRALWDDPASRRDHLFWVWLQRALDDQFSAASKSLAERGIALKGDLPILMNEDSSDVWAHGEYFRRDLAAGAPPDMFSPLGQNWQFPIYDWDALGRDDYSWWRDRLALADRYYAAYRIDHVLGFFRIWAASRRDKSAVLGRFIPAVPIERADLTALGFDSGRIRWLSRPHIPSGAVYEALIAAGTGQGDGGADATVAEASRVFDRALDRIGDEELWLFKDAIHGERDLEELGLHPAAVSYLQNAWRDRALLEYEDGRFAPTWTYWDTRAFPTLSDEERRRFEELISRRRQESERIWEDQGRRLLSILAGSTPMLACAEDLGAVPDCVPRTLEDLGVLGLRVLRWARRWGERGEPYIPLDAYPELSVCTPAVHDSSTVREWWEGEADRDAFRSFVGNRAIPDAYGSEAAAAVLGEVAKARSKICMFQIQDLLHLSPAWYAEDAASERVNVPGTVNDFNWTYRLPAPIRELVADERLVAAIAALTAARSAKKEER